jgi:predicted nucleic acid-binding protein
MMNQPKVYLETSVVSYLTSRPSRDLVIAGHQQITSDWWLIARDKFLLVTSQLVIQEASVGDEKAAQKRLKVLQSIELLEISESALTLAQALVTSGPIPNKAIEDALHIAIAVINGIDYLVTWNCKHIANATMRSDIEKVCRSQNYQPVTICTPEELLGD